MKIIIKNGMTFYQGAFGKLDILIEDDIIKEIAPVVSCTADETYNAEGLHVFPGFVDLHAHLRDPGQTYKEDLVTGTKAAAKGGFTTVCAMPNTDPVADNIATVEYIKRKAKDLGYCKVHVIGALTKKSEGKEIAEIATMLEGGIVAVSDDGKCVQNAKLMLNAMRYTSNYDIPVIVHAEDYNLAGKGQIHAGKMATALGLSAIPPLAEEIIISRDIMLAEATKCRLHIAHLSTEKSVVMVKEAKQRGIKVTAEVTPHHLLLNENATATFDTNTKVKPPLRSERDRQALIAGLLDGTIDFIATDHAPHADYEKEKEFDYAPFGINGFETAFAALYSELVLKDIISLEVLLDRLACAPANFLKLNVGRLESGFKADILLADLSKYIEINVDTMLSKSSNTPYLGKTLQGAILTTFCDGKITWKSE